jgi:ribosomal protein L44E
MNPCEAQYEHYTRLQKRYGEAVVQRRFKRIERAIYLRVSCKLCGSMDHSTFGHRAIYPGDFE